MSIVPISVSTALVRMSLREGFGSSEFDGSAEITRLAGHILHVAVDFTDAHTGRGGGAGLHAASSSAIRVPLSAPTPRRIDQVSRQVLGSAAGLRLRKLLGGPGCEKVQGLRCGRGGFGDVEGQRQSRVGDHVDALVE